MQAPKNLFFWLSLVASQYLFTRHHKEEKNPEL